MINQKKTRRNFKCIDTYTHAMLAGVWVCVITCVHVFYQLPHISLSNAAFKWQIAQKNKHTRTSVQTRTHTCQHVCMHKCIFVFHFFCFCFASCVLFGAVLLTWLKLEHNNNKSLQWNFATHTREHVYMYVCMYRTHTHTQSVGNLTARSLYFCAVAAASSSSSWSFASVEEENQ